MQITDQETYSSYFFKETNDKYKTRTKYEDLLDKCWAVFIQ